LLANYRQGMYMKLVITYLVVMLLIIATAFLGLEHFGLPESLAESELAIRCALIAALGGILYCLRSVYLNRCVHDRWTESWEVWYYLRPLTSFVCGIVAFVFLKAGLVVLDASQDSDAGNFGYYAFSFFAGLNVDKFVAKIEEIGKSLFGIEKTRNAKLSEDKKGEK
jgi:H+/Cl- antiporter ClcA